MNYFYKSRHPEIDGFYVAKHRRMIYFQEEFKLQKFSLTNASSLVYKLRKNFPPR